MSDPQTYLLALRAAHGERVIVLCAGEGESLIHFGVKLPDAAEWARIAGDLAQSNAAAAELALRRAVVGVTAEETTAERARLESILNDDPCLGDLWGAQILAAVGMNAKVETSPAEGGGFNLTATVGETTITVTCRKRSRPEWAELRSIAVKRGPMEMSKAAYDRLITSANKAQVAERYPALVQALGDAAAQAGSRAVAGAAPLGL